MRYMLLQGIDTPSPFLQLSGTVFKGQHQNLLGTELLFTDAKGAARLLTICASFLVLFFRQ